MIYLFNSAYRPKYLQNVVDTLFLPKRWSNEYRYTFTGIDPYIDPQSVSKLLASKGEEAVIIFADRYNAGGYKYYPLRKGKIIKVKVDGDRIFFKVVLLDFIYPSDITSFNNSIIAHIPNLPKLKNENPESLNDGHYAIQATTIFNKNVLNSNDSWNESTLSLSRVKAFKNNDFDTIFARLAFPSQSFFSKVKRPRGLSLVHPSYHVVKGKNYSLELYYKFPNNSSTNNANLAVNCDETLTIESTKNIKINSNSNLETISLSSKGSLEEYKDKIEFEFKKEVATQKEILAPKASIQFKVIQGYKFWIQFIIAILIFAFSEAVSSIDTEKHPNLTIYNFFAQISIFELYGGLVKSFCLFWLFKLIGKEVF